MEGASRLLPPEQSGHGAHGAHGGSGVPPLREEEQRRDASATLRKEGSRDGSTTLATFVPINYFDPEAPVAFLSGDLPHWRQQGTTYFVTFRLADSLPQEKLNFWREEQRKWLAEHPEPHDEAARKEYYELFPQRLQTWLDAGTGSCVLAIPEIKQLVEGALRHFEGQRYRLHEFVVAPNHVHALVAPSGEHTLSLILHSWKSFTAHEILKVAAASRRFSEALQSGDGSATLRRERSRDGSTTLKVWQKESFDHIVRSPASMQKFRQYIRGHCGFQSGNVATASRR